MSGLDELEKLTIEAARIERKLERKEMFVLWRLFASISADEFESLATQIRSRVEAVGKVQQLSQHYLTPQINDISRNLQSMTSQLFQSESAK